tara:strand:- start:18403 stop:19962 length:1560 start_codon:yes stop_codon:yes gene_type:complete
MVKRALITGITGQDGSYLAELLIEKGYEVHGIVRRSSTHNRGRIDHLRKPDDWTSDTQLNLILHHGDLTDSSSVEKIIAEVCPEEVYNLAAQSHVGISFDIPENTVNVDALGTLRLLEAIRKFCPKARVYQASSSEMFGKVAESPQKETTPFHPRSPYGCAKVFSYNICRNYREAYEMHISNGILFNHESERRGESFVTRKITRSLTRIKLGLQHNFSLGNLDTERDWGHSRDYVRCMWMMLQQDESGDYVIGTGEKHSVREFLEETARYLGMEIYSNNESGLNEKYLDKDGKVIVSINERYFRPSEVDLLLADYSKAKMNLGWEPQIKFKELVKIMADYDLEIAKKEHYLKERENGDLSVGERINEDECLNTNRWNKNDDNEMIKNKVSDNVDETKLLLPPAEIIDRMSILKLKIERIGGSEFYLEFGSLQKGLENLKKEGIEIQDRWIGELYEVNKAEWNLLDEVSKLRQLGENFEQIGRTYVEIEKLNKKRAEIKNEIVRGTGKGFEEVKKNHPSS